MRPATNLLHGVRFAGDTKQPLNLTITIAWYRIGFDAGASKTLFRELRRRVSRHWKYRRNTSKPDLGSFDDAGAHENPRGYSNTHWMVRVPEHFLPEFEQTVRRLLAKLTKNTDTENLLLFQPIYAPGSLAKYVLKGISPAFQAYFRIEAIEQGFIEGRGRTFVSRSLSHAARKSAGWKRNRQGETRENIVPSDGAEAERPTTFQ